MESIRLKETDFALKFNEYGTYVLKDGYLYNEQNLKSINECIEVLKKGETGLLIIGNPGSGKTLFFEMCQRITPINHPDAFVKVNVLDVVLQFNNTEIGHLVFDKWKTRNVFFDDLGTEGKGAHYGDRVEVFEKFIQFRYELFRSSGIKTHFTSNLSYDDLKARYGMRCMSRLNEMCTVVLLGANSDYKDLRRLKNFKGLPLVIHPKVLTEDDLKWRDIYADAKAIALSQKMNVNTPKKAEVKEVVSDETRILINKLMDDFDKLNKEQEKVYSGKRFVEYDGMLMDQDEFIRYQIKQQKVDM